MERYMGGGEKMLSKEIYCQTAHSVRFEIERGGEYEIKIS